MNKKHSLIIPQKYFDLLEEIKSIDFSKIKVPFAINSFTTCINTNQFIKGHSSAMMCPTASPENRELNFKQLHEFIKAITKVITKTK